MVYSQASLEQPTTTNLKETLTIQKIYRNIVNKTNPWLGMNLETVVNGKKITSESLQESINEGNIPTLKNVITNDTKIIFHANQLAIPQII